MPVWLIPLRHKHGGTRDDIRLREHFQCPECGFVSHHPSDVREGYCTVCHWWTGDGLLWAERAATTYQQGR